MDHSNINNFIQAMLDEEERETPELIAKKMTYSQLLRQYMQKHGIDPEDDTVDMIPFDFTVSSDLDKKIQILQDALEQDILLEKSSYYPDILEGIREEDGPVTTLRGV